MRMGTTTQWLDLINLAVIALLAGLLLYSLVI